MGILALRRRAPVLRVLAAATPAFAVGHLLGRIGCFLVGDDYGRPSSLPWAVAFPDGRPPTTVPVHPTQLYEAAALAGLGWALLHWRASGVADRIVLGRYLAAAGLIRFTIEFIRVNDPVVGPLTLAQLFASGLTIVGIFLTQSARVVPASRNGALLLSRPYEPEAAHLGRERYSCVARSEGIQQADWRKWCT